MGVGQAILNVYKNDMANENIELTIYKREEKVMMTKSEEILALCMDMTEEDLKGLSELLEKRATALRREKAEQAKTRFIEAYKEFRKLAPGDTLWVDVLCEGCDCYIDAELYTLMDETFT
jgi:hypothetical protein